MKPRNRSIGLTLAIAGQLAWAPGALAQSAEPHVIDVLVVPTDGALEWAQEQAFGCDIMLPNQSFYAPRANDANPIDFSVTPEVIQRHVADLDRLFGIPHVCESMPELAESASSPAPGDAVAALHNLLQISIAETNRIYADSGIDNVEFRLVGWAPEAEEEGDRYPSLEGYVEFNQPSRAGKRHANGFVDLGARIFQGQEATRDQIASLQNMSYAGEPEREAILNDVHEYREQYHADIVVLMARTPTTVIGEAAGLGIHSPDSAFAWVSVEHSTAPYYTFAHELTHLLGGDHYGPVSLPLVGDFDVLPLEPDFVPGTRAEVDNQGYIDWVTDDAQIQAGRAPVRYYGTLMSKSVDCKQYVEAIEELERTENPDDIVEQSLRGLQPCHEKVGASFDNNFMLIPRLSTTQATVTHPDTGAQFALGQPRRNVARAVGNSVSRVASFGESFSTRHEGWKVGIDFGLDRWGWSRYQTREPGWNNITSTAVGARIDNLVREGNGAPSGISAEIRNVFDKATIVHPVTEFELAKGPGDMPTMAMTDGFLVKRGGSVLFGGLDPNKTYHFRVFSSASTHDEARPAKVRVSSGRIVTEADGTLSGGQVKTQGTHFNLYRFFDFAHVRPSSEGEVQISIQPDDGIHTHFDATKDFTVNLNAIELFEDTGLESNLR